MIKEKSELRRQLIEKRAKLSNSELETISSKIVSKLINYVNWQEIKTINVFQTIRANKEVDVSDLISFLEKNYPSIKIDKTSNKISVKQNVPQGKDYDVVIVPLLGFDRSGNRLGYGGGYYDKFLATNNCKKAFGLAYGFQEIKSIPVEEHDQKLDAIITEKEIIKI